MTSTGTTGTEATRAEAFATPLGGRPMARFGRAFDVVTLAVLAGVAYLARRGSLPSDGLWFDDSWVAAGAILGEPVQLLTVGSGHPGFTAILMAVDRSGGGLASLGVPSLVFGIVAPAALYLGLRSVGYERAISAILSAALVVAPIHVLYSGRVKGYALDTLTVLLIAVMVPLLARRTWSWLTALAWVVVAIGVGTFSGYALLAMAAAGVILVLHPVGDRRVRIVAVAIQTVVQGAYLVVLQSKSDLATVEEVMETAYDGHMSFSWSPLELAREVLKHLRRLAEVFPGTPGAAAWWLTLLALLSIGGLVVAAVKGRQRSETLVARYLLLLVVLAAVGSFLERFPFGPANVRAVSAGGRHTLWMVPALAFGLAAVGHRARRLVARGDQGRLAVDAVVVVTAIAIIAGGYEPAPEAPFPGSASAARFVDTSIRSNDVVIVSGPSTFSFAISTTTPVGTRATPDHQVGFAPIYLDRRIHNVGGWAALPGSPADIPAWTSDADRVFVVVSAPFALRDQKQAQGVLVPQGFTLLNSRRFLSSVVDVYGR
jgi:hypothetical protein